MSSIPETAGMHELDNKAVTPTDRADQQAPSTAETSAAEAPKDTGHFSPDPLKTTDRRLC